MSAGTPQGERRCRRRFASLLAEVSVGVRAHSARHLLGRGARCAVCGSKPDREPRGMRAGALDSAWGPLGDGICQTPPGSRVVAAGERRCAFAFVREDAGGFVEKLGVMNVMPRGA